MVVWSVVRDGASTLKSTRQSLAAGKAGVGPPLVPLARFQAVPCGLKGWRHRRNNRNTWHKCMVIGVLKKSNKMGPFDALITAYKSFIQNVLDKCWQSAHRRKS